MHQGDGEALTWLGRGKTTKLLATVLKKIRLYCIIAKYDSFIQVWGEKKEMHWKHIYKTYVHILSNIFRSLAKNRGRQTGIRIKY